MTLHPTAPHPKPAPHGPGTDGAREPTHSRITLHVNGAPHTLVVDNRAALLDVLRERLGLIGAKKGCDHGQCGACTVLVAGRRANSCLLPAVAQDGYDIITIEGLAARPCEDAADATGKAAQAPETAAEASREGDGEVLHPLQRAFLARDAFQCGYCTPGQICSAAGAIDEAAAGHPSDVTEPHRQGPVPLSAAEIRARLSGNLCRCGAYPNIVAAVKDVIE